MKKILMGILMVVFLAAPVLAVDNWYPTDAVQVAWDNVTASVEGDALDPDEKVKYYVYVKNADGSNIHVVGTVVTPDPLPAEMTYTVTLENYGKFLIGVSAVVLWVPDGSEHNETSVSWSDEPLVCQDGVTFGVVRLHSPAAPGGLRK